MREKAAYTNSFHKEFYNFYEQRKKSDMKKDCRKTICYVVVNVPKKGRLTVTEGKTLRKLSEDERSCGKTSIYVRVKRVYITIAVMMAKRSHLFPFRTQKLSSFTPKVLAGYCWEDR